MCRSRSRCFGAAASAEGSGKGAAHDMAHGGAHSHTGGRRGHLSHETWLFGLDRSRGQRRWRWSRRRWSVGLSRSTASEKIRLRCSENTVPKVYQEIFQRNRTYSSKALLR